MTDDNGLPVESLCSSGYGSNGTSEITLSSNQEDAYSSRSCSVSTTEETPDYTGIQTSLPVFNSCEDSNQNPTIPIQNNGIVIRRSKASVDKLKTLSANRASCPTSLIVAEQQLNLNSSFGSAHSSSNTSVERLTGTDDEVVVRCRYFAFN